MVIIPRNTQIDIELIYLYTAALNIRSSRLPCEVSYRDGAYALFQQNIMNGNVRSYALDKQMTYCLCLVVRLS